MGRIAKIRHPEGRVNLYIDPRMRSQLVRLAHSQRRSLNKQIELMLEAQLQGSAQAS